MLGRLKAAVMEIQVHVGVGPDVQKLVENVLMRIELVPVAFKRGSAGGKDRGSSQHHDIDAAVRGCFGRARMNRSKAPLQ